MKLAIIGAGNVGGTLGAAWAQKAGGLGFDVVVAGPLRNARLLEAHAMLWIELALKRGLGRDWAFARVKG